MSHDWKPWNNEPDYYEWYHAGLPCVMIRHSDFGHWCGYVGVPLQHPLYGCMYTESHPILGGQAIELSFTVHGGITYSSGELRKPEQSEYWWFGFDAGHCGDLIPNLTRFKNDIYRDFHYMKNQCELLAEQLAIYMRIEPL